MGFPNVSAVGALLGLNRPQDWRDRIKEGAYTSPGGTRIIFDFEDVSRETEKWTTAFAFRGVRDEYVQDNGHGSRKYPLRCIFSGDDCDRLATAFEAALLETGIGRLEHPLYGTFDVVPFGTISRRDGLKDQANVSVVEVTFWTTTRAVYPSGDGDARSEILAALEGFDVAAAQQFAEYTRLQSRLEQANMKAKIRKMLRDISAALSGASSQVASVRREFQGYVDLINSGIDVLVGQPLLLAQQMINLTTAPARAIAGIRSRLEGYADLLQRLFQSSRSTSSDRAVSATQRVKVANDFRATDLAAMSAVAGTVGSVLRHEFTTKPEAIAAAEEVIRQLDELTTWREERFEALGETDDGGSYQALQEAVALTAGFLVEVSFTLVPERSIVLERPRTALDVCAELYRTVEGDRLDFLITSNDLSGSEIFELPAGKEIFYYAQ